MLATDSQKPIPNPSLREGSTITLATACAKGNPLFRRGTLLFFFFSLFTSSPVFSQQELGKIVQLDSVMITAVKGGFSVEDFIYLIRQDTFFYKAFKNLHYYAYKTEGNLTVFNKNEKEKATLFRKATQYIKNGKKWMLIDEEKVTGKMYNRKKEFNYYTAELYDYTFFSKDTTWASNIINYKNSVNNSDSKNQKNKEKLKTLIFNPGAEVKGVPLIGNRLAIFDKDMVPYYDYKISVENYNDTVSCYVFSCKEKQGLGYFKKDKPVIKELVSYFERKTFNILSRKYVLSYSSVFFDFDVTMNVNLKKIKGTLVPDVISYSGYWDLPFKSAEIISFKLKFFDYQISDTP